MNILEVLEAQIERLQILLEGEEDTDYAIQLYAQLGKFIELYARANGEIRG